MRRPVHIAGFAQLPQAYRDNHLDEAEMVRIVTAEALQMAGLRREDVGFTCSGSFNCCVKGKQVCLLGD